MLSLHTNNAALSAQNSISRSQNRLSTSMTRLGTGLRIASAMDDAAGLQIAIRLKAQTSGMAKAMLNTQNGISMMQTAEGALDETTSILIRMKDLATQAADASSSGADQSAMQAEFDQLTQELTNVVSNTSFGGAKLMTNMAAQVAAATAAAAAALAASTQADIDAAAAVGLPTEASTAATAAAARAVLNASTAFVQALTATNVKFSAPITFQIGASSAETMAVDITSDLNAMHAALLSAANAYGFTGGVPPVGTELTSNASATIDLLQTAIDSVATVRSALGAAANRLNHAFNNLASISSNTRVAAGRIMDGDFATESANMISSKMLLQGGAAMLNQSNSVFSLVLSLLR